MGRSISFRQVLLRQPEENTDFVPRKRFISYQMRQNSSFVPWKRFRRNEKEAFNPFQPNCFVGYPENPAFASKHLRLPGQLSCWISSTPFGNRFASETVRKVKHSSERIRNSISAFTWTKPVRKYPPFSGQNVLGFCYRSDIRVTMAQRKIQLDLPFIVRPRQLSRLNVKSV